MYIQRYTGACSCKSNKYYIFWVRVCCSPSYPACILLYCHVACPALQCFSTLSHKRHDFREKLLNIKCVFFIYPQILSENFSFLEELSEIWSKLYIGFHVNYPFFLSYFDDIWILWSDFGKVLKYRISWKSFQWGAGLFNAYRRTDITKLIVAFRNFANA